VAALACAREAEVVAVDAEPSMLDLAGRNAPAAYVRHAVLPQLPFPDASFDATVANFVINHVGDPAKTVTELRRVRRRGGHVAATIWPHPQPPLQQLWGQIFDAAGAQRPATTPAVAADKDFERTTDGFTRLLRDVKFTDVRCQTITWTHHTDPEEWWSGPANGIGNLGLLMETQPPAMIDRIKQEYDRLTAAYLTKDGVLALPTGALLASGRAT
jgi:SAM-dependent methyltransferase